MSQGRVRSSGQSKLHLKVGLLWKTLQNYAFLMQINLRNETRNFLERFHGNKVNMSPLPNQVSLNHELQ